MGCSTRIGYPLGEWLGSISVTRRNQLLAVHLACSLGHAQNTENMPQPVCADAAPSRAETRSRECSFRPIRSARQRVRSTYGRRLGFLTGACA